MSNATTLMPIDSDYHRRKNEAARRAATESLVEQRKSEWRDKGLVNDLASQREVEVDESIWQGRRWWRESRWVRPIVNLLIVLCIGQNAWVIAKMESPFSLAFWIPVLLFLFQLRIHIGRFGA